MRTTVEIADRIAKMVLALGVIVMFFIKVIAGPIAVGLFILSIIVVVIEVGKIFVTLVTRD